MLRLKVCTTTSVLKFTLKDMGHLLFNLGQFENFTLSNYKTIITKSTESNKESFILTVKQEESHHSPRGTFNFAFCLAASLATSQAPGLFHEIYVLVTTLVMDLSTWLYAIASLDDAIALQHSSIRSMRNHSPIHDQKQYDTVHADALYKATFLYSWFMYFSPYTVP